MLADRGYWMHPGGLGIARWFYLVASILFLGAFCLGLADDDLKSLVKQAFELHQKGQFSQALPLLRRAYQLQPDDYFVNLLLGIDSLRTGEAKASVSYLRKASRLRPKEEFPLAYLGEAYADQEMFGDAADAYLKAARVAPGSPEGSVAFVDFALARFAGMSALLRSSKKGLAAEYRLRALAVADDSARLLLLQRAADLDPAAPGIWSDLARTTAATGDLTAAEDDSHRALEADPNDLAAWIVDAQLAAHAGNWTQASKQLNAVAQHSPRILSDAVRSWPKQIQPPGGSASGAAAKFFSCVREEKMACAFVSSGGPSLPASLLFRQQRWESLTRLPAPPATHAEEWLERGITFAHLQKCPEAIPALERGIAGSSLDVYGMYLLSWCYSREAGRIADQVQQSASDDASLHVMRGDILLRLQAKSEMATVEYQQALAREAKDPAVLERLAEAQFGSGKTDDARASAQAALDIDPQRLGAKRTLAKIAIQERDYAAALPYLRELAARNPGDVTGRVELGKACAQTGALDEARDNLASALEHGYPDEKGTLHYLLGSVLKKMGRTAEADQAFSTAAQLSDAFQHKSYRDQDSDAQP